MRITIEATNQKVMTADGTECWLWRGRTAGGLDCLVAVASVGCLPQDAETFEREAGREAEELYDGRMFGEIPPKPI
ncbi:MAG: hypothetical protein KF889_15015 [Alphaproteobacteria bacterium]|nr:hypothetical protein [Alphaproteobacteria bacterium]MCW5744540.1 hypothetical protein [Alphaproteobacteria bacterium]